MNNYDQDKFEAFCWAYNKIKDPREDWIILNTKTTGLGNKDEIIEIGILSKYGSTILDTLIKPTISISSTASNIINGITDTDVDKAPSLAEVYPQICKAIEGKTVIIYNSKFHIKRIKYSCEKHGLKIPDFKTECLMLWYSQYVGHWNWHHQSYHWQKFPSQNDRAIGEAIACHKLISQIAKPMSEACRVKPPLFPPKQIFCEWKNWIEIDIVINYIQRRKIEIKRPRWYSTKEKFSNSRNLEKFPF